MSVHGATAGPAGRTRDELRFRGVVRCKLPARDCDRRASPLRAEPPRPHALTNTGGGGPPPSLQGDWYPAALVKDVPAGRKFAFEDNTSMVMKLSDLDEFVRLRAAHKLIGGPDGGGAQGHGHGHGHGSSGAAGDSDPVELSSSCDEGDDLDSEGGSPLESRKRAGQPWDPHSSAHKRARHHPHGATCVTEEARASSALPSCSAALVPGGTCSLSTLMNSGALFSGGLRSLVGNGIELGEADRSSLIDIMSTVSTALHDDFARKQQRRIENEQARLAVVAERLPTPGLLGTLPELALLHVFSFAGGYDLRCLHCVNCFRSEEGLGLLKAACTELHARVYPGRVPLGVSPAWTAVYIQQDADAAVSWGRGRVRV